MCVPMLKAMPMGLMGQYWPFKQGQTLMNVQRTFFVLPSLFHVIGEYSKFIVAKEGGLNRVIQIARISSTATGCLTYPQHPVEDI